MPYSSRNIQGGNLGPGDSVAANPHLGAADLSIAFLVKYVGAEQSGTVEIAAAGDVTMLDGDVGSEAAAGNPLETGGTAGNIDVSDVNANELGDVIDAINANANWIAVAIDSPLGELTEEKDGGDNGFKVMAATQAKVPKGIPIYWGTAEKWADGVLVAPDALRNDIRVYQNTNQLVASSAYALGGVDPALPFQGRQTIIYDLSWSTTYGSGASELVVYSVDPTATDDRALKATKVVYTQASGATTVNAVKEFRNGLQGERGNRLMATIENTAAMSVTNLAVSGELNRKLN